MKRFLQIFCASLLLSMLCSGQVRAQVNAVFMGNSITRLWNTYHGASFLTPNGYLGKGIDGQVTAQMLGRFGTDVINNKPKVVVIMAGINDIAQNQGYIAIEQILENIATMTTRAKAAGIKPILCTTLPASGFGWTTKVPEPAPIVRTLNTLIEQYARENDITFVDYYSAFVNTIGGMNTAFCSDRVHPLEPGYELLEQIIQPYLIDELKK